MDPILAPILALATFVFRAIEPAIFIVRRWLNHDVGFQLRAVRGGHWEPDILPSEGWDIVVDVWSTTKERLIIERIRIVMNKPGLGRDLTPLGHSPIPPTEGWPNAPIHAPITLEWPESQTFGVGAVRAMLRQQYADIEWWGLEFTVSPRRKFRRRLPLSWRRLNAFPPPGPDDVIGPHALEGPAPIERVPSWRRFLRRWPPVGW